MKIKLYVAVILIIFSAISSPAWSRSRVARPLDIRSDGSRILGCIPLDEGEAVEVANAGVSPATPYGATAPRRPWGISLKTGSKSIRLEPGQCIVFDELPDGYYNFAPTAEIQDFWPYSFSIRSDVVGKYGTRNHSDTFCVSRRGGAIKVAKIPRTHQAVTSDSCKQLLGAPDSDAGSR
jgi:hypothetical protein